MSPAELLNECASHGITLEADGGTLRYHTNEGALTPALREKVKAHKAELLAYLNRETDSRQHTIPDPAGLCPTCGCGHCGSYPVNPGTAARVSRRCRLTRRP
jgi:hypothetical protein